MNILTYMLLMIVTLAAGGAAQAEVAFLAYGDLRGYLEPCGCDPATDMGGILRINSQLRRERMTHPDVPVFNLGNNLSEKARDTLKNSYLLKAEAANQPGAYLLNELELRLSGQLQGVQLPFVLSNAQKLKGIAFKEAREVSGIVVYGYTYRKELSEKVRPLSAAMLDDWKTAVSKHKSKPAVLLFSGSDEHLKKILAADIFDTVVSSNRKPLSVEPGKDEAEDESLLLRTNSDRPVFMVPAGGQGILRGGAMTREEAKPVAAYLLQEKKPAENSPGLFFSKPVRVTWLKKDTEAGHALADLYADYTKAVTAAFQESSKARLAALAGSPFAGDAACASCHQSQHAVYKKSAHAHAMQTLIDKNKHQDPECVACHSVGAEEKGGFVSVKDSPHLANVQCENCHGPRKEHARNPAVRPEVALKGEAMCTTCHNAQHSPRFEFSGYWEKIKH